MSKINISFNDKNYQIDDSALSPATSALRNHLSTVMNGTGATINFGGAAYNVDSTKLSDATTAFTSHLATIAGNGHKVVVNGREYSIDSTKVASAIAELEATFGGAGEERLEGDGAEYYTLAPTALSFRSTAPLNELQEIQINGVTVDPSNYTLEEGSTIVTFPIDYLKTLNVGNYEVDVVSESKSVKGGFTVAAPELNEHGFYYNVPYGGRIEYLGGVFALVFKHTGEANIININDYGTEVCSWSMQSSNTIRISSSIGEFDCAIDSDEQISCAALGSIFGIETNMAAADKDWLYVFDGHAFAVMPLNRNQNKYLPIKSYINKGRVYKLSGNCFMESKEITEAPVMPSTLMFIGNSAFEHCSNLASLTLPQSNGYLEICGYAFSNTALSEVYIPSPLDNGESTQVCTYAFSDCKNLRKIVIGERVGIGIGTFSNCTNLTTIIYEGTTAQWNAITKGENWNNNVPATYVQCSDGQVAL